MSPYGSVRVALCRSAWLHVACRALSVARCEAPCGSGCVWHRGWKMMSGAFILPNKPLIRKLMGVPQQLRKCAAGNFRVYALVLGLAVHTRPGEGGV